MWSFFSVARNGRLSRAHAWRIHKSREKATIVASATGLGGFNRLWCSNAYKQHGGEHYGIKGEHYRFVKKKKEKKNGATNLLLPFIVKYGILSNNKLWIHC